MQRSALLPLALAVVMFTCACRAEPPPVASPLIATEIESGGLGLPRSAWNRKFSPATNANADSAFYNVAFDKAASVIFTKGLNDAEQRVLLIDIRISSSGVTEDEARTEAMKLLPRDAVLTGLDDQGRRGQRGRSLRTDLLRSDALAEISPLNCLDNPQRGLTPGQVFITYITDQPSNRLSMVSISWACWTSSAMGG